MAFYDDEFNLEKRNAKPPLNNAELTRKVEELEERLVLVSYVALAGQENLYR